MVADSSYGHRRGLSQFQLSAAKFSVARCQSPAVSWGSMISTFNRMCHLLEYEATRDV